MNKDFNSKKFNLTPFLSNLIEWIEKFKIAGKSGHFAVEQDETSPSLYGVCDTIFNLRITNQLEAYFNNNPEEDPDSWASVIQSYQDPNTGWFKEGLLNYGLHFKEHSSAFCTSALKLIGAKPKYPFKIREKLNTKEKVFKWLRIGPQWGLLYWPGSHRGGGIAAIFATLGPDSYPHPDFFDWYFEWLDQNADPKVGFWRLGWIHKLFKNRLTKHELGGAVHYYWIYHFFDRAIPYPKKVIDATLTLQNKLGTWDSFDSYCIDLDAVFCLLRCREQVNGYREEDIEVAIGKYLSHIVPKMNDKEFFFNRYTDTHKLTGYLCALAEINKFYPSFLQSNRPLTQTLDITPWI